MLWLHSVTEVSLNNRSFCEHILNLLLYDHILILRIGMATSWYYVSIWPYLDTTYLYDHIFVLLNGHILCYSLMATSWYYSLSLYAYPQRTPFSYRFFSHSTAARSTVAFFTLVSFWLHLRSQYRSHVRSLTQAIRSAQPSGILLERNFRNVS